MKSLENIETVRLKARKIDESDFSILHSMNSDPQIMATLGGICDEGETKKRLVWNLNQWKTYAFGLWLFYDKSTKEFVGRGGIMRLEVDGVEETEIGYVLIPSFWGKGLELVS